MSTTALPTAPSKKSNKNFKATYLRVLLGGVPQPEDWWAAKELIDTGHATGHYLVSRSMEAHGEITSLVGFAPTLMGRLFSDDLAQQATRQTWRYRLIQAVISLGSFVGGWFMGVTTEVGKTYVLRLLGL